MVSHRYPWENEETHKNVGSFYWQYGERYNHNNRLNNFSKFGKLRWGSKWGAKWGREPAKEKTMYKVFPQKVNL